MTGHWIVVPTMAAGRFAPLNLLVNSVANVEAIFNYYVCMLSCFFIFQEAYFICVYMYVRKYQLLLICYGVIT